MQRPQIGSGRAPLTDGSSELRVAEVSCKELRDLGELTQPWPSTIRRALLASGVSTRVPLQDTLTDVDEGAVAPNAINSRIWAQFWAQIWWGPLSTQQSALARQGITVEGDPGP